MGSKGPRPWGVAALTVPFVIALAGLLATAGPASAADRPSVESAMDRALDRIAADPILIKQFMRELPKGADLHHHLSGSVYAESMLRWAIEDGLCISLDTYEASSPPCETGQVTASDLSANAGLQSNLISAWSMRNALPASGESGHDHFFNTFARFDQVLTDPGRMGSALGEVLAQAAHDHVLYLETKITPEPQGAAGLVAALTTAFPAGLADPGSFPDALAVLQAAGLAPVVTDVQRTTDAMITRARTDLHCLRPDADAGCDVSVGFIAQVIRNAQPAEVFALLATGFAVAAADDRWVAVDLVSPEDGITSLTDYHLHMQMIRFLRSVYPGVHVTLHAGELTPGLVPPKDLDFHITDAVMTAGAKRIGHGVAIRDERDARRLLRTMRDRGISAEVSLTSNQQILGIDRQSSQFLVYRAAGVPVVLSTDDEGVERIDLSREYQKAYRWFDLSYADLKKLSYQGVTSAFVSPEQRKRLKQRLDGAFRAFEAKWIAPQVVSP